MLCGPEYEPCGHGLDSPTGRDGGPQSVLQLGEVLRRTAIGVKRAVVRLGQSVPADDFGYCFQVPHRSQLTNRQWRQRTVRQIGDHPGNFVRDCLHSILASGRDAALGASDVRMRLYCAGGEVSPKPHHPASRKLPSRAVRRRRAGHRRWCAEQVAGRDPWSAPSSTRREGLQIPTSRTHQGNTARIDPKRRKAPVACRICLSPGDGQ